MDTFEDFARKNPSQDPLDIYRRYSDEAKVHLLETDQYDPQLVADIDGQLQQHAVDNGLDLGDSFAKRPENDEFLVSRYAPDPVASQAATRLRALRQSSSVDPAQLEAAELAYNEAATPELRASARREALTSGQVPFATFTDKDGNERIEVSPELEGADDATLAKIFQANPDLDRTKIPMLKEKLAVPEGYTAQNFTLDRQNDLFEVIGATAGKDPSIAKKLNQLRLAADKGLTGNLDPMIEQISTELSPYVGGEFGDAERKKFIKDYVTLGASAAVNPDDVDSNLKVLSTGQVHVPTGVLLNKPLFEKTLAESTLIPEAQKATLAATRDQRLQAHAADAFATITANRPEFVRFMDERKAKGATDAAILDEWMANPENHSTARDFAGGIGESVVEGLGGLVLYPMALAGNDAARGVIADLQQSDADRRSYAKLFGSNLGVGYDVSRLIAPVAADIGVTLLTGGAAGAAVGAKTTARAAIKSTLSSALNAETKSLAKDFVLSAAARQVKGATVASADDVLKLAGQDIAQKFTKTATTASYLATAFNRSAGATYVQLHSTLEKQKNADGSPKYTPEQVREISLNHGLLAGTMTAAITGGFSFLGKAGMERIYEGMTQKQLSGVFNRVRENWRNLTPEVREGLDVSNADRFLESVIRKSVEPMWKTAGKATLEEGSEEALDEFVNTINTQVATGEKIDPVAAAKQAAYAGMLGGIVGGGVNVGREALASATPALAAEDEIRRQTLLATAQKLDAAHSPNTAAVLRRFAMRGFPQNTPQEDVPPVEAGSGDVAAPSDAGVAEASVEAPLTGEGTTSPSILETEQPVEDQPVAPETAPEASVETSIPATEVTTPLATGDIAFNEAPGVIVEEDQIPEREGEQVTRWSASDGLGTAEGFVDADGALVLSNIEAKARGTEFLDRVLDAVPAEEVVIPLQSNKMQAAVAKLVKKGKLQNARDLKGVEQYPTRFTIAQNEEPEINTEVEASSPEATGAAASGRGDQQLPPLSGGLEAVLANPSLKIGDPIIFTSTVPGTQTPTQGTVAAIAPNGKITAQVGKTRYPNARLISEDVPTETAPAEAPSLESEIPVEDIFTEVPADAPVDRDGLTAIAGILTSSTPEQQVAANRKTVDAYLEAKGIKTEGLNDADRTVLIRAAEGDSTVRTLGRMQEQPAIGEASTVAQELRDAKFTPNDPVAFLQGLVASKTPEHRTVAKLLLRHPEMLANTTFTTINAPGAPFAGVYAPSTRQVLINTARPGPRGAVDTVLHEMLHAATEHAVLNPTAEQEAVLKRLDRVRASVAKRAPAGSELQYATSSSSEFITHFFTSPEFQKQVAAMTPQGEKNWFRVILDTIRDLLNLRAPNKAQQITSDIMADLVRFTDSAAAGIYGTSRMDQKITYPNDNGPERQADEQNAERDISATGEGGRPPADFTDPQVVQSQIDSLVPEGQSVSLDTTRLAEELNGVDKNNAEDIISSLVNRDLAHQAGVEVLGEDVPAEEVDRLLETLRMATSGNTLDSDIAFYKTNPDARERLVRYLTGAAKAMWERLKLRFDTRTAMMTDRIAREVEAAENGYKVRSMIEPFNPDEPTIRQQPAADDGPLLKYTNYLLVNRGNKLYKSTETEKPGWLARMFARRDDLSTAASALKVDKEALFTATEKKLKRLEAKYNKSLKTENPDMDVLRNAIGSTAPLLTPDEETRINAELDQRLTAADETFATEMDAARKQRDKDLRRAKDDDSRDAAREAFETETRRVEANRIAAQESAMDWGRAEKDRSQVAQAAERRRVQSLALQSLEVNAPLAYEWANEMRETTNELQRHLSELYKESRPELAATIDRSNGVYLVRSYEMHRNPAYAEMVMFDPKFQELRDSVMPYFTNDLIKAKVEAMKKRPEFANTPEADLEKAAREDVHTMETAQKLFEDFVMGHENSYQTTGGANSVKLEIARFMRKRNLDPEITKILGEIEDPLFNATRTLSAVAGIIFTRKMHSAILEDGLANGTIIPKSQKEANSKYRNWEALVSADEHSQVSPLAGYYSSPEDKAAWDAAFNSQRNGAKDTAGKASDFINKAILGAAGTSLGVMTLGSPGYFTRNMVGGALMAIAQGVNPFNARTTKLAWRNAFNSDSDDNAIIEELVARRILSDGVNVGYLRDFLKRYQDSPLGAMAWAREKGLELNADAVAAFDKLGEGKKKGMELLTNLAEFTETFATVPIYLHKLEVLLDSGMEPEAAHQEAARRTKMVTPSKSESSQAITAFSKSPISALIAPFLRFKSELFRNLYNTYKLGFQDLKSGNKVLRDNAIVDLSYAAAVHAGLTVALPLIMQAVAGISGDEDEAIRKAMPSYSKNSSFIYKRGDKGELTTWDLTFTNPFSFSLDPLTRSIRAALSNDFSEIPAIASRFVTDEFLGENVVAGKVLDLTRNKDEGTAMPIWLESDDFDTRLAKGIKHVGLGAYTPAAAKKLFQAYEATNRPSKDDEPFFFTPAGIVVGMALPTKPRSYEMKDLAYRASRSIAKENSELWTITNPLSSPAGMAPGEPTEVYQRRLEAGVKVKKELMETMKAYESLGLSEREVKAIAVDAGHSKRSTALAWKGFMDRPVIAAEKLKDIREIDPERHAEVIRAMKQHSQLIDLR